MTIIYQESGFYIGWKMRTGITIHIFMLGKNIRIGYKNYLGDWVVHKNSHPILL